MLKVVLHIIAQAGYAYRPGADNARTGCTRAKHAATEDSHTDLGSSPVDRLLASCVGMYTACGVRELHSLLSMVCTGPHNFTPCRQDKYLPRVLAE